MKKNHCGNINQQNASKGAIRETLDRVFALFCKVFSEEKFAMLVESFVNDVLLDINVKLNPDLERQPVFLGQVYLVDFGYNKIGSELQGKHYIVPYSVRGNMVSVVPLTSQGNRFPEMRVPLGVIDGLNGLKSYASINQRCSISIARLKAPRVRGKSVIVKLKNEQFKMIVQSLISTLPEL